MTAITVTFQNLHGGEPVDFGRLRPYSYFVEASNQTGSKNGLFQKIADDSYVNLVNPLLHPEKAGPDWKIVPFLPS